jgi:uncharacterized protein YdeI (YjbR/CyaY-like superfamily)
MGERRSPVLDAYIAKAAPFARPILEKIRELMHRGCPELEETMKWSHPHFDYKGIFAGMAAFKQHVTFGFWKGRLLKDDIDPFFTGAGMVAAKITDVSQLPSDKVFLAAIRQAAALNDEGVKVPKVKKPPKPELAVPPDLRAALKKDKKASATFQAFSPSHRREYIEWLLEAKQPETREKRLNQAVEWMAAGKPRNWKYMRK